MGKLINAVLAGALAVLAFAALTPPALAANTFDATVTWTATGVANHTGFNVYRKLGTAGTYAQVGQTAATVLSFTDPNLVVNTQYCYKIGAFNSNNEVQGSETCATTGAPVSGAPGAPTILFIYKP